MAATFITVSPASVTMEAYAAPLEISELDRLVNHMPVGVVVEGENGQIVWVNRTFLSFFSTPLEQLHAKKIADLPLIRIPGVGGNPDFCQIECPRKGGPEWLLCSWQRIAHENGRALIARFYIDATEHRRVQRFRGRQLSLPQSGEVIDPVTGTLDRAGIAHTLESEVSRSRRYQNPLAVIRLRLEVRSTDLQHANVDQLMAATARVLREQTRWVDRIGRWSEWEFLLVLPESNAPAAASLAKKIERHSTDPIASDGAHDLPSVTVRFGIAEWQRGDDAVNLLERAHAGLEADGKAKASNS